MLTWRPLWAAGLLTATATLLLVPFVVAAPLRQEPEGTISIAVPEQDDTLRGLVQIIGTAQHPDFNHYLLEFGFEPNLNDQWFPVQDAVAQQVQQGSLALWDTTELTDRDYQLRLRIVLNDGSAQDFVVRDLHVSNQTPAGLPTIVPSATPSPTVGVPTLGPSPTALIQQPPTRTPRPQAIPGAPTLTPTPNPDVFLESGQVRSAVCSGAILTFLIFTLLGAYATLRRYARRELRDFWRSVQRLIERIITKFGRGPQ